MEKRANLECGMQEFVSASWLRWFFYNKVIHFFFSVSVLCQRQGQLETGFHHIQNVEFNMTGQ